MKKSLTIGMLAAAMLVGCEASIGKNDSDVVTPRTDGERAAYEAKRMDARADMLLRAERLIADGRGMHERGETLKQQGKTVDGERISAEGDAKIREGEALQEKARAIETTPPSTRPSDQTR